MISKEQLSAIARKTGLQLYQQEKEYLLKLFLYFYYKRYDHAIFKGGTCLRYLFGLNRFSEDLDFNIKDVKKFQQQIKKTVKEIELLGFLLTLTPVRLVSKDRSITEQIRLEISLE